MKLSRGLLVAAAMLFALTAAEAQTAPPAGRTLKIGVLTDQSGPYADSAGVGAIVATRMAVEDSGLRAKGWTIEVIAADHQNKPDVAATIARQWYDVEGVDMIADVTNSAVALAVNQVTRDRNKVMLASGAATSDLTGKACSPNTVHWTNDTWAQAHGTGDAVVKTGGRTWFFITADYAFGQALERDTTAIVKAGGGSVLGSVRAPLGTADYSSFLLQAQASKARIVGLASAGTDATRASDLNADLLNLGFVCWFPVLEVGHGAQLFR